MFDSYVIEIEDRAVGLILREGRGFAFHAVDPRFSALEGTTYADAFRAERAARALRGGRRDRSRAVA